MTRCLVASITAILAMSARAEEPGEAFFEKSVRPILVEKCVGCHGPTAEKGGLRLDSREAALLGGADGVVLVPGKPAESKLLAAVKQTGELKMPKGGKLSNAEVAALEKWIALGAPWPAKAKLLPPKGIEVAGADHWAFQKVKRPAVPAGAAHPIDAFVNAKLAGKKLAPSPEADRRTLIRRLTFDLHGLPPTPAEVTAFVADDTGGAYEKLIDRLLASARYGERWARHWLDVARYADNKGYVFFEDKNYPWAWTYRDYVIGAFNKDLPYDRFVLEQLAADRLELADGKSLAALGFLTVGGHFMGNTHDVIDDRIDTVTRGFMGLTASCARCHDHKFDPIPAADYYSLYGVFRSGTEPIVPPLYGAVPDTLRNRMMAGFTAMRERKLVEFVTAKHGELVAQARARAGDYLYAAHLAKDRPSADDFMLIADKGDLNPAMISRFKAFLDDTRKRKDPAWALWHRCADATPAELVAVRTGPGDPALLRSQFALPPQSMKEVAERIGRALALADAARKYSGFALPGTEPLLAALYGPNAPADAPLSLDWGFLSLFPDRGTQGEYQKLVKDVETWAAKGPPRTMALLDAERPYDPKIFLRGNPNRPGADVPRQFLKVLDANRKPFAEGSGRLEFAEAIASEDNPLTARVFVNRVWMHHFGKGIVGTPGDFGLRGDPPTHPELLDWLASQFVADGWSAKKLHKLILTSAAYKRASSDRKEGIAADPENALLWKQNRRRLEFEALHDAMLAVSGSLDYTEGGPSVPLFAGRTRRAVYGAIDRLEFPSLLATFDVPNPAATSPERSNTTVAPQSLYLMNGPFARDAAKRWVNSAAVKGASAPAAKLDALFLSGFGRKPTDAEAKRLLAYVAKGPEAERWIDLAHGLLMTNEFAFVD